MDTNIPMWVWEDAVDFIAVRCNISREDIERVLELEDRYMREIGLIVEEEK